MKKFFILALMAIVTASASAQLITSSRVTRGERAHNWWVDLGLGTFGEEGSGLGLDLGLRYTKMWGNIGWDIIKISATTDTKSFDQSLDLQAKTGLRYISNPVSNNLRIYGNAGIGFGWLPMNDGLYDPYGIAWEIGAGVMIGNRISVGIVHNRQHDTVERYTYEYDYDGTESSSYGLTAIRFGFAL